MDVLDNSHVLFSLEIVSSGAMMADRDCRGPATASDHAIIIRDAAT